MLLNTPQKVGLSVGALLFLCSLFVWGLFTLSSWHSAQLEISYKQGYVAAENKFAQEALKKSVKGVRSAREARGTQEKAVQAVRKKANEAQAQASTVCTFSNSDVGLLNGTIDVGNAGLRVHGDPGVPGARKVQ